MDRKAHVSHPKNMTTSDPFAPFAGQKYLCVETLRKNGAAVRTPVWFAAESPSNPPGNAATLYFYTIHNSGKIKRIRNNPRVRIAPCGMRGEVQGPWSDARAEIIEGEAARHATKMLDRKYFPLKQILNFFALLRGHRRDVVALHPA
jgi:PPOX class probable F420-dependent enzyme